MSTIHHQGSSGAPTFTAASASLSFSGLDGFDALVDPDILDSAEWFHSSEHHARPNGHRANGQHLHGQRAQLSPSHEFPAVFGQDRLGTHPVTAAELQRAQYPTLATNPMEMPLQPRLDDLHLISPVQQGFSHPQYNPTPYPDSTASSAPSEEPAIADQAADEDKRKRNQAASARFRQKKKQREQQMVEQSRELADKTKRLEGEVDNLKRENTFLKRLLVEKVDNMSREEKALLAKTTKLAD